ncbi:HIG1 domain family member 1A, mitochondrial-like [Xylocopa sonorina]|uniref:HIG1 domain family member 1A, mitochondrial-like n=1 Tax=Xylocopa sonorina TaxID=1818115 RepID=UPI00403AD998
MDDSGWKNIQTIEIPEEAIRQSLENERTMTDKVYDLVVKKPFIVAGVVSLVTICGIGAYKWKTKTVIPSVFLGQLRVIAQGTALGFITLGMAYNMYNDFVLKKKKEN